MQLILDIGNSGVKYAVYSKREAVRTGRGDDHFEEKFEELVTDFDIDSVLISAVREIPSFLLRDRDFQTHFLNSSTPLPIRNKHLSATMGTDRIAAVVGAHVQYPEVPKVVIDAGTCITFDIIDAQGEYLGGTISPGLRMRYRAMATFTDKLEEVKPPDKSGLYGSDTTEALQLGGMNGLLFEIQGYYLRLKKRWEHIQPVLTGGDAPQFADHLKMEIFVHPNLVLMGSNEILLYNE